MNMYDLNGALIWILWILLIESHLWMQTTIFIFTKEMIFLQNISHFSI